MDIAVELAQSYRNKTRVRVAGILIEADKLLLVNHRGLTANDVFWNPPGGGVELGEPAHEALVREFLEETGLQVKVQRFLFVNEVITNRLHAIELFFEVQQESGVLGMGKDPEHSDSSQMIQNVAFLSLEQIQQQPKSSIHNALENLHGINDLLNYELFSTFHR